VTVAATAVTLSKFALDPQQFLRSVAASRDTLARPPMKLLDVVAHVRALTSDAPYAVVGGLAQILWARKTHTDDLDVALASNDLESALSRVRAGHAGGEWALPSPPDRPHEENEVFEVAHLLYEGAVVDLLSFKHAPLTAEILASSVEVSELGGVRFVRPELLLVMHLLRPGSRGAIAALELVVARGERGGMDLEYAKRWADAVGKGAGLEAALRRASEIT